MEPIKYQCDCCGKTYDEIEPAFRCCADISVLCGKCGEAYFYNGATGMIHARMCAEDCCEEEVAP